MKNFIFLCSVSDMTFDSEPLEWIEEFPEKKNTSSDITLDIMAVVQK